MILKPTETESLLHGTPASFALLLPNEPLLWCQEAHSSALLEDFRGTRKDRQGLKCLRKDMALYNPQRRSSSNLRTPRHTHAHVCTHTHTHTHTFFLSVLYLQPQHPQEQHRSGDHTAVRRGPSAEDTERGPRATTQPGAFADQPSARPAKPTGRWTKLSFLSRTRFHWCRIHRIAPDEDS